MFPKHCNTLKNCNGLHRLEGYGHMLLIQEIIIGIKEDY
jgi:hypothetical protein